MTVKELRKIWRVLSEKIKDRLSGDTCAEIGVYDFDAKIEKNKKD